MPANMAAHGLPKTVEPTQLTWGLRPVQPGPQLARGQADGRVSSCLLSSMLPTWGWARDSPDAAVGTTVDPRPDATALRPWLPGYCLFPTPFLPSHSQGCWLSEPAPGLVVIQLQRVNLGSWRGC